MKKILAVVLALVMTLAMGTAAFAYVEVAPGQIYVGPAAAEYLANPGDTVSIDIRYAGSPNETDGYPTEGSVVVSFFGTIGDVNYNKIERIALTQEAIDAGVKLIGVEGTATEAESFTAEELENANIVSMFTTYFIPEEGLVYGAFMMPASLVDADFNVLTITTKIADDWEVVDYVAKTPIDIAFFACENAIMDGFFVTADEAAAIEAGTMLADETAMEITLAGVLGEQNTVINAMPYQPSWGECLEEQLKGVVSGFLDVLVIVINLLKGELAPADWFIPGEHDVVDLSFITDGIAALVGLILNG